MKTITSLQNGRVKDAAKLRQRRQREKQGRFLIHGVRELSRALDGQIDLEAVFYCPKSGEDEQRQKFISRLERCGAEIVNVSPKIIDKLAYGQRDTELLAIARTPQRTIESLTLPENPVVVVLEHVEKPGNVGAVIRSADASGISAMIVAATQGRPGTDLYNPNTIRASLGTIFTLPICAATSQETIEWLQRLECGIYAARVDAETSYTDFDYTGPTAFVLGSEAHGLSALWSGADVTAVKLPMRGAGDSLNVSVAAAVMFYEALRQRGE